MKTIADGKPFTETVTTHTFNNNAQMLTATTGGTTVNYSYDTDGRQTCAGTSCGTNNNDVVLFRPTKAGDYSSGEFTKVFTSTNAPGTFGAAKRNPRITASDTTPTTSVVQWMSPRPPTHEASSRHDESPSAVRDALGL